MEEFNKQEIDNGLKALIEKSTLSNLTKEIAMAIIEVRLMQEGKIEPLTLKDI